MGPQSNAVLPGTQPEALREAPLLSSSNFLSRFRVPSAMGFPWFEALGSDGNVYFTEEFVGKVGQITTAGVIKEFPIPGNVRGGAIAAGDPGFLWFTDMAKIGRVTTAGAVTTFTIPGSSRNSMGITKGPDGNMWFTDLAGAIGRITPAGAVKEFTIPTASSKPVGIAAGHDGNLWFTESGSSPSKVGRITTAGVIKEFNLPTPGAVPGSIVAAPDGNLYVGYTGAGKLARVSTAGVVTEFTTPSGSINALTIGPDNEVWISFHSSGVISEFNTSTHAFATSVAVPNGPVANKGLSLVTGSDGDVWLGDSSNMIDVYEETIAAVGVRLNGEHSVTDPHYGLILGYFNGTTSTTTQLVMLTAGEDVQFFNVDSMGTPHTVSFLGDATSTSAPWPPHFNGSSTRSPTGTAIGTHNFSTGALMPGQKSLVYSTGLPGFYMMGCAFHYDSNTMRDVFIVM